MRKDNKYHHGNTFRKVKPKEIHKWTYKIESSFSYNKKGNFMLSQINSKDIVLMHHCHINDRLIAFNNHTNKQVKNINYNNNEIVEIPIYKLYKKDDCQGLKEGEISIIKIIFLAR